MADTLSRATMAEIHEGIDYNAMAASQHEDPEVQAYRSATSGLRLEDIPIGTRGITLLCDISTGTPRPVVPTAKFLMLYTHPSIRATQNSSGEVYKKQVGEWAKSCIPCQISKIQWHTKAPLERLHVLNCHIHVDLVATLQQILSGWASNPATCFFEFFSFHFMKVQSFLYPQMKFSYV